MQTWNVDSLRPQFARPEVLRSDDGAARVITMGLKSGQVREHEGYEHGWVMVLDGRLEIVCDGETVELERGSLAHFSPYEKRKVTAMVDTTVIYLLTPWPGYGHPSTEAARAGRQERGLSES